MRRFGMPGLCAASLVALSLLLAACGGHAGAAASATPTPSPSMQAETPAPTPTPIPTTTPTEPPKGTLVNGWVAGIPDYVPKFECGTIDRKRSKIDEGAYGSVFMLTFTGVRLADVEAYATALTGAEYDVATAQIGDTYTMIAVKDLGYNKVTIVMTLSAEGEALLALEAPV